MSIFNWNAVDNPFDDVVIIIYGETKLIEKVSSMVIIVRTILVKEINKVRIIEMLLLNSGK